MLVRTVLSLYHAGGLAGSLAVWRKIVLDVSIARADGVRGGASQNLEKMKLASVLDH